MFNRGDGEAIPAPDVTVVGKVGACAETFSVPGDLNLTIDLAQ
jgi:hypothetical protein